MSLALAEPSLEQRCSCGAAFAPDADWCWLCYRRLQGVPPAPASPGKPARTYDAATLLTVAGAILIGAVFLVFGELYSDRNAEPVELLRFALVFTLVQYGVVSTLVFGRAAVAMPRPRWTQGPASLGIVVGLVAGAGAAGLLMFLASAAAGQPSTDDRLLLLLSEGDLWRVLAVGFIAVVAAPLVEELLFRGLLMEALRSSGRKMALWASAGGFAVWHLSPSSLRYYAVCGFLLGLLYLRFGLVGSVAAHAAFNGALFCMALVIQFGSGPVVTANGLSVELPGGWRPVAAEAGAPADVVVEGPSGSGLLVQHVDMPGASPSPATIMTSLDAGSLVASSQNKVIAGSVRRFTYPAGEAVRAQVASNGVRGEAVLIPKPGRLWLITFMGAGSARASADFEEILHRVELAGGPL